ncbi:hypothetical protein NP493_950g01060 [Ridgeia piscesae]|uniref:protein-tyrosine-phosphatase n=1 Tax=Ridgeia piscesae TaxID=27915 RepID=A0AAD9KJI7_RIDPI|nr:hypothetical protein NP493_950g01060 [Ridgeia piscesae]
MVQTIYIVLLVTLLAEPGTTAGTPCRFDSSSTSRGSCIFPCRCTKGCDQATGQCLDGGQCSDGYPSGYKWTGPACQIGNIALQKNAEQSSTKWGDMYLASNAVDGRVDLLSYQHCAVPNAMRGTNAWWKIDFGGNYKLSRVIIYNTNTVFTEAPHCPNIDMPARVRCGDAGINQLQCQAEGCCWDERATGNDIACYQKGSSAYDTTEAGEGTDLHGLGYPDSVSRRFGVNCEKECHCNNESENCQNNWPKGRCISGCAPHFTGPTCQECDDGHFGVFCDGTCHCSSGSCDKTTGHCPRGCADGWTGDSCQTDERRLSAFTLSVGNSSDVNDHTQCASHNGAVAAGATVNESCTATGRYLSFRRSGGEENQLTTLCEVVVIGHRYITCKLCPATSTCDDVIGCDACEPGKQQPHCEEDCDKGYYGVNCNETCGHCKDQSTCSITDGSCPSGCELWHISDVCKTYIAPPEFASSSKPVVADVTGSSIKVSWPKAMKITPDVEAHYHYIVWIKSGTESEKNVSQVQQGTDREWMEVQITGLAFNTKYALRVEPYRELNGKRDAGDSTGSVVFTTSAKAGGLSAGGAAGVSIGVILLLAGIAAAVVFVFFRLRRLFGKNEREDIAMDHNMEGAGQENIDFDYENEAEDEVDGRVAVADTTGLYMNVQKVNRGIKVADLAAYFEDKRHRNGFQKEFAEKTNTIVMLANLYELGREKCNKYWPLKKKTETWGPFVVESTKEEQFADYVIRDFTLKNLELKKVRRIRQLHFTAWPDKGTPDYAYPLLAFHRKVHSFDSERRGPLLVHCSAGVGRTGTFIAIDILTQQAAAEGKVDVFQCVNLLRSQRMDMVQTLRLNALKTSIKNTKSAALEPKNVDKNRNIEIIPDDQHRPYLVTPWKEGTNFINAVTVHGYKQRNAYIITQSPMTKTVVDLWRLLNDHESHTVVMLDDVDDTDGYTIYWPTKENPKCQYGPFEVELTETNFSENPNVTFRDFKLTKASKSDDNAVVVRQFHLKRNSWNMGEPVPSNKMVFLDLLNMVEKWQQLSGNGPITVHCSDGASRCGVLVAASYILEHLKIEQEVDVFHAVQHVRTTRPQLVTDLTQYRFLYQVALAYMSQFDTYANFQ